MRRSNAVGLLIFLLLLNILNSLDRNLVASFAPQIVSELDLSHTEFAIVTGIAFGSFYSVMALLTGIAADRINRTWVLTGGLTVWSLFTALSGLAQGFWSLVAARPFVAAGEATLIPTGTAMLSGRFSQARAATANGVFFMGIPVGLAGSYLVAATLGPLLGWRNCFLILGALGIVMALFMSRVRDIRPASAAPDNSTGGATLRKVLADCREVLLRQKTTRYAMLAMIMTQAHSATSPFIQLWLVEDRGMAAADAGRMIGTLFLVFGTLASATVGALADTLARRFGICRSRFLALYVALLAPFVIAFRFVAPDSVLFPIGMAAGILFFSGFYGPCFALLQRDVPDRLRSTITGLTMLTIQIVMIGIGGVLIGATSDLLGAMGATDTLTWPLVTADIIGLSTVLLLLRIPRQAAATSDEQLPVQSA
jgi:MFS family permease